MKKVSLREYSKIHKLSYFNVMKMVKNGDVKNEIIHEDGKDIPYVLIEEEQEKVISEQIIKTSAQTMTLKEENIFLKKEIERLKKELSSYKKV